LFPGIGEKVTARVRGFPFPGGCAILISHHNCRAVNPTEIREKLYEEKEQMAGGPAHPGDPLYSGESQGGRAPIRRSAGRRGHARPCSSVNPYWTDEFCVIFCDTDMHDNYLTHEVLHLYGAIDLYDYHEGEGVQRVSEKYFPNSDMLGVSHEVDELTAYLVGWMDDLTWDAWQFVQEVDGLRD
jgi:hypothetical protein